MEATTSSLPENMPRTAATGAHQQYGSTVLRRNKSYHGNRQVPYPIRHPLRHMSEQNTPIRAVGILSRTSHPASPTESISRAANKENINPYNSWKPDSCSSDEECNTWFTDIKNQQQSDPDSNGTLLDKLHQIPTTQVTEREVTTARKYLDKHSDLRMNPTLIPCLKTLSHKGKGVYGDVFEIPVSEYLPQGGIVKINKNFTGARNNAMHEAGLLCELSHTHVIKLLGFYEKKEHVGIVLEKKKCSMEQYIRDYSPPALKTGHQMINDMVTGMAYLHRNKLIHRDAHLGNFLIGADGRVVIADLGLTACITLPKRMLELPPILNGAPELTLGENALQSVSTDVFSLGFAAFSVLRWKNHHVAWCQPSSTFCQPNASQGQLLCTELQQFHKLIKAEQQKNTGKSVPLHKWLIHEVIPHNQIIPVHLRDQQMTVMHIIRMLITLMARDPEKRPDTSGILKTMQDIANLLQMVN